jgi:NNP family nitrate/nitrite transporter-like MFS transporter
MNIFARTLGGVYSDKFAKTSGLKGRVWFLGVVLFLEGVALVLFSRMPAVGIAVIAMIIFSLFVQMSEGATYGIVPFINKKAVGPVAGIVGAGGNAGAVGAGFLFRIESLPTQDALLILGILVAISSGLAWLVRFSPETEAEEQAAFAEALEQRETLAAI